MLLPFSSLLLISSFPVKQPNLFIPSLAIKTFRVVVQNIAITGALCCVAARPDGAKLLPGPSGPDTSTERGEQQQQQQQQHWRTNSSFSPPPSRIWDCRLQSDSVPHRKRHRDRTYNDLFTSHQHSVSDGALSYTGSLSDSAHASRRWTSPVQKFKANDASLVGGSRSKASPYPQSSVAKAAARSSDSESPSSLSEFAQCESSTSRHPYSAPSRHLSRRSHMSKAVYPLMFHNPVSDSDNGSLGRLTPNDEQASPLFWHEARSKFHQKSEILPDLSTSSRREGFRLSIASSYDMGFENDRLDMVDGIDVETLTPPSMDQKCGICSKLLHHRSPLCPYDMPVSGVLPCSHVFHADCLQHVTPKAQMHEPPCPLCLKGIESASSFSEPLQMSLRSRGVVISETRRGDGVSRKGSRDGKRWRIGGSSIKKQLKRHLSYLRKGNKATEA